MRLLDNRTEDNTRRNTQRSKRKKEEDRKRRTERVKRVVWLWRRTQWHRRSCLWTRRTPGLPPDAPLSKVSVEYTFRGRYYIRKSERSSSTEKTAWGIKDKSRTKSHVLFDENRLWPLLRHCV